MVWLRPPTRDVRVSRPGLTAMLSIEQCSNFPEKRRVSPANMVNFPENCTAMARAPGSPATGLLVECRDEPGVLYRITEAIFRHGGNTRYVAGGARREAVAALQLQVSRAPEGWRMTARLEAVPGATQVGLVRT